VQTVRTRIDLALTNTNDAITAQAERPQTAPAGTGLPGTA
jgi:hypothetical protein